MGELAEEVREIATSIEFSGLKAFRRLEVLADRIAELERENERLHAQLRAEQSLNALPTDLVEGRDFLRSPTLSDRLIAAEQRNDSLTQINALVETENDLLRDVADVARDLASEQLEPELRALDRWREAHGIDPDQRNTIAPATSTLNDQARLIAAERRAEAAERESKALLAAVSALEQSKARCVGLYPVKAYANAQSTNEAWSQFLLPDGVSVTLKALATKPQPCEFMLAVLLQPDAPDVTLLERRGAELIEAGEKLLAEYEKRKTEGDTTATFECRECGHTEARTVPTAALNDQRCNLGIPGDDEGMRCAHFMRVVNEKGDAA